MTADAYLDSLTQTNQPAQTADEFLDSLQPQHQQSADEFLDGLTASKDSLDTAPTMAQSNPVRPKPNPTPALPGLNAWNPTLLDRLQMLGQSIRQSDTVEKLLGPTEQEQAGQTTMLNPNRISTEGLLGAIGSDPKTQALGDSFNNLLQQAEKYNPVNIINDHIARLNPTAGKVNDALSGVHDAVQNFAAHMATDPRNFMLGAGLLSKYPALARTVSGIFGVQMAGQVPAAAQAAGTASVEGTPREQAMAYTQLGLNTILPVLAGAHALSPTHTAAQEVAGPETERAASPPAPTEPPEGATTAPAAEQIQTEGDKFVQQLPEPKEQNAGKTQTTQSKEIVPPTPQAETPAGEFGSVGPVEREPAVPAAPEPPSTVNALTPEQITGLKQRVNDNLRGPQVFTGDDMAALDTHFKQALGPDTPTVQQMRQAGVISVTDLGGDRYQVSPVIEQPIAPSPEPIPAQPQLPPTPKGEQVVTVQKPDGTTYQASYGGKKWEGMGENGEDVPSIGRLTSAGWSHGLLAPGEKILNDPFEKPAKPKTVPPSLKIPLKYEGWKLHLGTDDPERVSEILKGLGIAHKVGKNSGQDGKDITAYIGGKDAAIEAANLINEKAGHLLKPISGDAVTDDISFGGKVAGRFSVPSNEEFHQYGAKGHPLLNDDVRERLMLKKTGASQSDRDNFYKLATQRADEILKKQYGDFYTGKSSTPAPETPSAASKTPIQPTPAPTPPAVAPAAGESAPSADTVRKVRTQYTSGMGTESIKKTFSISQETLDKILKGDFGGGPKQPHEMTFAQWMNRPERQIQLTSQPEVAQPTPRPREKINIETSKGGKVVNATPYYLPGYKGPTLAVVEYKAPKGRGQEKGYRVYVKDSGGMVADSNGVMTLPETLKRAVDRLASVARGSGIGATGVNPFQLVHRHIVSRAIHEGKTVPENVLAEYPNLQKLKPKVAAAPQSEPAKPSALVPKKASALGVKPTVKKSSIVAQDDAGNYITKEANGYKVWRHDGTVAKLAGTIGFEGDEGLQKAKERLAQLSPKPEPIRYHEPEMLAKEGYTPTGVKLKTKADLWELSKVAQQLDTPPENLTAFRMKDGTWASYLKPGKKLGGGYVASPLLAKPVEQPAAKEPWQMTRSEYASSKEIALPQNFDALDAIAKRNNSSAYKPDAITDAEVEQLKARGFISGTKNLKITESGRNYLDDARRTQRENSLSSGDASDAHVDFVEQALKSGKPVPPEVLADYPELAKPAAIKSYGQKYVEEQGVQGAIDRVNHLRKIMQENSDKGLRPNENLGSESDNIARALQAVEPNYDWVSNTIKPEGGQPVPEKPVAPVAPSGESKAPSSEQKYRVGNNPTLHTLVEKLPQTAAEKENNEQAVRVRNDKTGDVATVMESDLTPVKEVSGENKRPKTDNRAALKRLGYSTAQISALTGKEVRALAERGKSESKDVTLSQNYENENQPDESLPVADNVQDVRDVGSLISGLLKSHPGLSDAQKESIKNIKPVEAPATQSIAGLETDAAAWRAIARSFNQHVIFLDVGDNPLHIEGATVDGVPNVLFLNARAERTFSSLVGHELLHNIENESRPLYNELVNKLAEMVNHGEFRDFLNHRQRIAARSGRELNASSESEELVAQLFERSFDDPEFWNKMAQKEPAFFQRLATAVLNFLNRLIGRLKDNGAYKYFTDIDAAHDAIADALARFRQRQSGASGASSGDVTLSQSVPEDKDSTIGQGDWVETIVGGNTTNVRSKYGTFNPESTKASIAHAREVFDRAGIPVASETRNDPRRNNMPITFWRFQDFGKDDVGGEKLILEIRREISDSIRGDQPPDQLTSLLTSVETNFEEGTMPQFSAPIRQQLFNLSHGYFSEVAARLGAKAMHQPDLTSVMRNVDVHLGRARYDAFGGDAYDTFFGRILKSFKSFFTNEEIEGAQKEFPQLKELMDRILAQNYRDYAGRVFRKVQQQWKEKQPPKRSKLELDSRIQEAAQSIIEEAKTRFGIEVKPPKGKPMTPYEQLLHATNEKNAAKIAELMEGAVADAEYNAGRRAMEDAVKTETDPAKKQELVDHLTLMAADDSVEPLPEYVEKGLDLPEYQNWKTVRDNWFDYSPVSMKLIRRVLKGDFRGTKFGETREKPEDTRLDLNALAKQPEAEVKRILDAYYKNTERDMENMGATEAAKMRTRQLIEQQVAEQLEKARQRVLDAYLAPKDIVSPKTAPEKLHELINAGLEKDPRYEHPKIQKLVRRIAAQFATVEQMRELAVKPRAEKVEFIQDAIARSLTEAGINPEANAFGKYAKQIALNEIATRLFKEEEKIVRSIVDSKDVLFGKPAPKSAGELAQIQTDRIKALQDAIYAGTADAPTMDSLARKRLVARLAPKIAELTKELQTMPEAENAARASHFADSIMSEIEVDPALRDKVRGTLESAFNRALDAAKRRINDRMFAERIARPEKPSETEAITQLVNSGFFKDIRLDIPDMVATVAEKSKVKNLLPSTAELSKRILNTPAFQQSDIQENFVNRLIDKLNIPEEQAQNAWKVFSKAFESRFETARARALQAARDKLTEPEQRKLPKDGAFWKKVEQFVNAGGMDSSEFLAQIAKDRHGWVTPTPEQTRLIKSLVDKEQQLRTLPKFVESQIRLSHPDAKEDDLNALLEERRKAYERTTTNQRAALLRRLGVEWTRLTRPINFLKYFDNKFRRNNAQALNEYETLDMLTKVGFAFRLPTHIATQLVLHTFARDIGEAIKVRQTDIAKGRPRGRVDKQFWQDTHTFLRDSRRATLASLKAAAISSRAEILGRGETRNMDRIMSGINALERLNAMADRENEKGRPWNAALLHFVNLPRVVTWFVSAIDHFQGKPAEYQEMLRQIETRMREDGRSYAEIESNKGQILDMMKSEFPRAVADARSIFDSLGEKPSEREIEEAANNLVTGNIYAKMKRMGLPADAFEEDNKTLKATIAWQFAAEHGIGGIVARSLRGVASGFEHAGIPTWITRLSNAIGTGINYSLMNTPFYKLAAFKTQGAGQAESPWFRTDLDRNHRMVQGLVIGSGLGGLALAYSLSGLARVNTTGPRDKKERDAWIAQGHKPGTVEFTLPDGSFIPISLSVGPMSLYAPYLMVGGAIHDLAASRQQAQAKLDAEAKKKGLPAGTIAPISSLDVLAVAGNALEGSILSSRTAGGLAASLTEQGLPNAQKTVAAAISPLVPGLPALQEISRMMGVQMDPKTASVWDFLVPMPTSPHRSVNVLGEPVETPDDLQRVIQVITAGTYPGVVNPKELAEQTGYATMLASGYVPPSINPGKGYDVDGSFRPLNDTELQAYTVARGQDFKSALAALGPNPTRQQVQQAYQQANGSALQAAGVTVPQKGVKAAPAASRPAAGHAAHGAGVRSARHHTLLPHLNRLGGRHTTGLHHRTSSLLRSHHRRSLLL